MSTPKPFSKGARAAAVLGIAALSLTACAGGGDKDAETNADGVTQLVFHSWLPTQDQWTDLIAAFEEENEDIKITFTREEDFDAYITNLDNEILADEVPDIYGIQVGSAFNDYASYALPASEYAQDWIGSLNVAALEQTTDASGEVAAVPILNGGMQYYLYNKTIMDDLNLTLPENYDELKEVSAQVRAAGYSPFAMGAADTWHVADFFVWLSNQYGSGGDIYRAANGEIAWDSPNLVAAAQQWQDLFTDGVFQDAATTVATYPNARDDYFLAGKSPFFPTGSWHVGAALATSPEVPGTAVEGDEIGMAVFPTLGSNQSGVTSGVDFALAISNDSSAEKQEAAAKFVKFMAVGTGQQMWVNTLQGFPVANDISVELGADESELAQSSVDLVTKSLQDSTFARKLVVEGRDSLETDLGIILQNIADGADPAKELATLNK